MFSYAQITKKTPPCKTSKFLNFEPLTCSQSNVDNENLIISFQGRLGTKVKNLFLSEDFKEIKISRSDDYFFIDIRFDKRSDRFNEIYRLWSTKYKNGDQLEFFKIFLDNYF